MKRIAQETWRPKVGQPYIEVFLPCRAWSEMSILRTDGLTVKLSSSKHNYWRMLVRISAPSFPCPYHVVLVLLLLLACRLYGRFYQLVG